MGHLNRGRDRANRGTYARIAAASASRNRRCLQLLAKPPAPLLLSKPLHHTQNPYRIRLLLSHLPILGMHQV
jgi:hypothetical protein